MSVTFRLLCHAGGDAAAVQAVRDFAHRTGLLLRAVVALMGAAAVCRWWGHIQTDSSAGNGRFDNRFFKCAPALMRDECTFWDDRVCLPSDQVRLGS